MTQQPPPNWGADPDSYAEATTEGDFSSPAAPWPGVFGAAPTPANPPQYAPTVPMAPLAPPRQPVPSRWSGREAAPQPYQPPRPARRRAPWRRVLRFLPLVLILALCVGSSALAVRLYAFGKAISPQSPLSSQTGFMSGPGRVNFVILGYGGVGHDGAYLSDSMMLVSLNPSDRATTMISVPRDLWVQVPPNSGNYAKLNAAFADGMANGYNNQPPGQLAGGMEAAQKVSDVTGLQTPYFMAINFNGFRDLVNALGGVDINVPVAFTANYPINDDPSINAGWKTIHFNAGEQHMNGETAIEYARARYVISPASEGSDFARSGRQQLLMRAIVHRLQSPSAWPGMANALNALQSAIYTNLSLADLMAFTFKVDLNNAAHVQLTTQNVLIGSQSSDGQDILLPGNGGWDVVKQYVAAHLKS